MNEARNLARELSREIRRALKVDFHPGQHVGVPDNILSGICEDALSRVIFRAETAEKRLAEYEAAMQSSSAIHINMLRGSVAKLTPAQIGHLYKGDEATGVIREIERQNPDVDLHAVAAEREACAKIAEQQQTYVYRYSAKRACRSIAAGIRARGSAEAQADGEGV